jgi:hypothetical protein
VRGHGLRRRRHCLARSHPVVLVVFARFAAGLGAAVLVGAVARHRTDGPLADPITSPLPTSRLTDQDAPLVEPASPASRLTALAVRLESLIPVWTVVMLAVTWWLTR